MAPRSVNVVHPHREALKTFLAAASRPAETLTYHQLQGFLFSVTSSPEVILPSEWLPMVFAQQDAGYRNIAEARSILDGLMSVYNEINAGVAAGMAKLPDDCAFRDEVLANLEPVAPISQWCQGFTLGHDWLSETWEAYAPDDDEDFGTIVLVLSFFTGRRLAEAYRKEFKLRGSLKATAVTVRTTFPESLRAYAGLGRMISAVVAEHDTPKAQRTNPRKSRKARSR